MLLELGSREEIIDIYTWFMGPLAGGWSGTAVKVVWIECRTYYKEGPVPKTRLEGTSFIELIGVLCGVT